MKERFIVWWKGVILKENQVISTESILLYLCFFIGFLLISVGRCFSSPILYELSSNKIVQGGVTYIKIKLDKNESPRLFWMKKSIPLYHSRLKDDYVGILSADLMSRPGRYFLKISLSGMDKMVPVQVLSKDYGVRRLTLPDRMVRLSKEDLLRVKRESRIINELWNMPPTPPMWSGGFELPLNGKIIGSFGRKSIINGLQRSPHSGVDIRAPLGTPVKASNSGKVALCGDFFFSGKSIIIDHGMWIYSMYFHLSRILVREGEEVKKGQIIGYSGATGRATGPHLHFGVRVNGSRVDPLLFIEITKNIE